MLLFVLAETKAMRHLSLQQMAIIKPHSQQQLQTSIVSSSNISIVAAITVTLQVAPRLCQV